MFSSFKFRPRKSSAQPNSKKPNKWRLEGGLCSGAGRSEEPLPPLKEATADSVLSLDSPEPLCLHQDEGVIVNRVVGVCLERDESCGLGINLRGGRRQDGSHSPLQVTFVMPNSPADREGTVRVGDRLLAVNGRSLAGLRLAQVEQAVRVPLVWLTVEYDVSVLSALRAAGPLIVDVESPPSSSLGLTLIDSASKVIVSNVRPASLAERCGALLPGDQILCVNGRRIDSSFKAADVTRLISESTGLLQIEILPVPTLTNDVRCPSPSWSQNSNSSRRYGFESPVRSQSPSQPSSLISNTERCQELKVESAIVTLHPIPGQGYGLKLRWVPSKLAAVISDIEPASSADRSGLLQIGDRIRSVNGCLPDCTGLDCQPVLRLEVEFDVEIHSLLKPGSTVVVRLARSPRSSFGVTINGCSEWSSGSSGNTIVVSGVRWGSVAHRCGRLAVGDLLVAIGDTPLLGDIHLATSVLNHSPNIVTFTILKQARDNLDLGYSSSGMPSVDSTVESWDNEPSTLNSEGSLEALGKDLVCKKLKPPPSPPCPLQTNYRLRNNHWRQSSYNNRMLMGLEELEAELKNSMRGEEVEEGPTFHTFRGDVPPENTKNKTTTTVHRVMLYKDPFYEDFGFSVSDGLYEKGVFINRIRPGGPAALSNQLKSFDRIIQVNDTKTDDFDCCLTVPLVASSPDPLMLTVCRSHDVQVEGKANKAPEETNSSSSTLYQTL